MNVKNALLAGTLTIVTVGALFIAPLASADYSNSYGQNYHEYPMQGYNQNYGYPSNNFYNLSSSNNNNQSFYSWLVKYFESLYIQYTQQYQSQGSGYSQNYNQNQNGYGSNMNYYGMPMQYGTGY